MHSESILLYIPNECHHAIDDFFNRRKYINKTMFVEICLYYMRRFKAIEYDPKRNIKVSHESF